MKVLLIACILLLSSPSEARKKRFYSYKDEKGNMYFVSTIEQVPKQYRNQIKGVDLKGNQPHNPEKKKGEKAVGYKFKDGEYFKHVSKDGKSAKGVGEQEKGSKSIGQKIDHWIEKITQKAKEIYQKVNAKVGNVAKDVRKPSGKKKKKSSIKSKLDKTQKQLHERNKTIEKLSNGEG